jgi:ribose/xylose/arabinose/galactoside ABC-type transport system permease subunit
LLARLLRRREVLVLVVMAAIFALSSALHSDFAGSGNIESILAGAMPLAVLAVGQTIVCLGRGIDLSVAPTLGITAVSVGFLAQDHGLPLLAGVPIVLAIGTGLGAVNGLLVAVGRIPPIIATLGTLSIYAGIQALIVGQGSVYNLPHSYFVDGNGTLITDVPYIFVAGVAITALVALGLRRTTFGRSLYAVGNNADAAYRAGIRIRSVLFSSYVVCGLLAGLGGLMFLAQVGSADSTTGSDTSIQLYSIAAALIGGTALTGGKGGVVGSFLGAIFLSVALQAMIFAQISSVWEPAGVGVLVLLAVIFDRAGGGPSLRSILLGPLRGAPS